MGVAGSPQECLGSILGRDRSTPNSRDWLGELLEVIAQDMEQRKGD